MCKWYDSLCNRRWENTIKFPAAVITLAPFLLAWKGVPNLTEQLNSYIWMMNWGNLQLKDFLFKDENSAQGEYPFFNRQIRPSQESRSNCERLSWYSHSVPGTVSYWWYRKTSWVPPAIPAKPSVVPLQHRVPGKKVAVASLMFLCNNKLYQGWAVLTTGITVSPYGLLPIRVQGSWNAKMGPNYFTGGWNSAICHVHYNSEFAFSKCWITVLGDAHMRSRPEFGV